MCSLPPTELSGCLLPELLRLLPSTVLPARECEKLCLLQAELGSEADPPVPGQDGLPGMHEQSVHLWP